MKATKIYYEQLRTSSNFNNTKVGIELEIADGEKAKDVLLAAKLFVQAALCEQSLNLDLLENMIRQLKNAQDSVNRIKDTVSQTAMSLDDEIPF